VGENKKKAENILTSRKCVVEAKLKWSNAKSQLRTIHVERARAAALLVGGETTSENESQKAASSLKLAEINMKIQEAEIVVAESKTEVDAAVFGKHRSQVENGGVGAMFKLYAARHADEGLVSELKMKEIVMREIDKKEKEAESFRPAWIGLKRQLAESAKMSHEVAKERIKVASMVSGDQKDAAIAALGINSADALATEIELEAQVEAMSTEQLKEEATADAEKIESHIVALEAMENGAEKVRAEVEIEREKELHEARHAWVEARAHLAATLKERGATARRKADLVALTSNEEAVEDGAPTLPYLEEEMEKLEEKNAEAVNALTLTLTLTLIGGEECRGCKRIGRSGESHRSIRSE